MSRTPFGVQFWLSWVGLTELPFIYEKTGDTSRAVEYYEKFLSLWGETDSMIKEMDAAEKRLAELKED